MQGQKKDLSSSSACSLRTRRRKALGRKGKGRGGGGGGNERKGTSVPTFLIQGYTACQVLLYATKGM